MRASKSRLGPKKHSFSAYKDEQPEEEECPGVGIFWHVRETSYTPWSDREYI